MPVMQHRTVVLGKHAGKRQLYWESMMTVNFWKMTVCCLSSNIFWTLQRLLRILLSTVHTQRKSCGILTVVRYTLIHLALESRSAKHFSYQIIARRVSCHGGRKERVPAPFQRSLPWYKAVLWSCVYNTKCTTCALCGFE